MKIFGFKVAALMALAGFLVVGFVLLQHAGLDPVHAGAMVAMAAAPAVDDWQRELQAVTQAFEQRDKDLRTLIEKGNAEVATAGKMATETKNEMQALVETGTKLQARLLDVEQKLGRRNPVAASPVDLERMFNESEAFKAMQAGKGRSASIQLKRHDLFNAALTTSGSITGGSLVVPDRQPGIITPALRPPLVRDLVMPGRTSSNAIEFVQETGFTNNADVVTEGTLKPESDITFELVSRSVRTLAHWVKASKQILDDVPMLMSYVGGRLTYGLKYKEDYQLLRGDNTGQNLDGLIPNATDYQTARTKAGDSKIDVIRHAITQVREAEYRATAVVVNPTDWDDIETEKDANGRYIWANVTLGGQQQLWRLPVIDSTAMNAGEFLVGAFQPSAQIFDREDASVVVSNEDNDNFTKNMVTILVEERLVQAVYRPESFVYGDYSAVTG